VSLGLLAVLITSGGQCTIRNFTGLPICLKSPHRQFRGYPGPQLRSIILSRDSPRLGTHVVTVESSNSDIKKWQFMRTMVAQPTWRDSTSSVGDGSPNQECWRTSFTRAWGILKGTWQQPLGRMGKSLKFSREAGGVPLRICAFFDASGML